MSAEAVLKISDAAADRIKFLLEQRGKPSLGVRLGTTTKGCNGLSYKVDYVDEETPGDEKITDKGVTVYIDGMSVIYLIGSTMDYKEDKFQTGFTFENPNATGTCGCGESFSV